MDYLKLVGMFHSVGLGEISLPAKKYLTGPKFALTLKLNLSTWDGNPALAAGPPAEFPACFR